MRDLLKAKIITGLIHVFVCCSIWMVSESELLMWTETHHSGFLNFSLPWRWCCDVGKLPSKTVVESENKCDVGESWELEGGATNRCLTSVVGLRWPSKPSWKPEVQIGWDCNRRTTLAIFHISYFSQWTKHPCAWKNRDSLLNSDIQNILMLWLACSQNQSQ